MMKDPLKPRVVSPSSEIIGEGAAIFMDMTETIWNTLDQHLAMSSDVQKLEGLPIGEDVTIRLIGDDQMDKTQGRTQQTSDPKERYPDLFLLVAENHRISDQKVYLTDMKHLYMQWIELMELCMVSLVWDTR